VDASGTKIFVPDRTVIRGVNGYVAGVPPREPPSSSTTSTTLYNVAKWGLTGEAAEGADAKLVALRPLAVAVDAKGQDLYILEPDAVRYVNLLESVPTIRTIAGAAAGTTITASTSSVMTADTKGRVFIGDAVSGTIYRLDKASGKPTTLTTLKGGVGSLSVDAGAMGLYAAAPGGENVLRVNPDTGASAVVAGGGASNQDNVPATSARIRVEAVAVDPFGGQLYISDGVTHRIRKVDLLEGTINSVVGSGQTEYQDGGKAASFAFHEPFAIAVDLTGSVFMLIPNDCALFMAVTPAVIFTPPPPTKPLPPQPPDTTQTGGTGQDSTNTGSQTAQETVGGGNQGAAAQQGGANQTHILPGDSASGAAQPQTELRIIDQGNAITAPNQATQAPAQFSPSPAQTPTPTPAADSGTVAVSDPGSSTAAVPDLSPTAPPAPAAVPVPPAPAPVPPAPASAPPPAATQPVTNPGLVHGDSAAPTRGATRYAMVRNDEQQSLTAALAMAGAGVVIAVFLCMMFVAPGPSSKPKPRPKGAY
jgi:hypothetical protein